MEDSGKTNFSPSTFIHTSPFPSLPLPPPSSLPSFLLHSPPHPSRPAFIDAATSKTLTFSELSSLVAAISDSLLRSLHIRPNDIVLLVSPNSIHFPALSLGIMASGAILSTANPLLTRRELLLQIKNSSPSLILTTPSLLPKLLGLTPRPPLLIEPFLLSLSLPEFPIFEQGIPPPRTEESAAALMYSSGTTGRSKGVMCTHENLVHEAAVMRRLWGRRNDVFLCVVPMFHMFGFSVFVCGAVAAGATVVVMERYTVKAVMEVVEREGVTRIPAVPPMVVRLVKRREAGYNLGSLKEVVCSGAPLPKEFAEGFVAGYPGIVLSQVRGRTP